MVRGGDWLFNAEPQVCEGVGRIAIRPIYTYDAQDGSDLVFMLSEEDYRKIAQGYGCPRCLEDYHGVVLTVCPVCKHRADVLVDLRGLAPRDHQIADPSLAYAPTESIDLKGY